MKKWFFKSTNCEYSGLYWSSGLAIKPSKSPPPISNKISLFIISIGEKKTPSLLESTGAKSKELTSLLLNGDKFPNSKLLDSILILVLVNLSGPMFGTGVKYTCSSNSKSPSLFPVNPDIVAYPHKSSLSYWPSRENVGFVANLEDDKKDHLPSKSPYELVKSLLIIALGDSVCVSTTLLLNATFQNRISWNDPDALLVTILLPEVDALPEYVEVVSLPVPPNTNRVSVDHCWNKLLCSTESKSNEKEEVNATFPLLNFLTWISNLSTNCPVSFVRCSPLDESLVTAIL